MKKAIISGASGQDGSYLSALLLKKNYEVWGLVRSPERPLVPAVHRKLVDVTKENEIRNLIQDIRPDEVYHLATGHEVGFKTDDVELTRETDFGSTRSFLKAIEDYSPKTKFFYASSSRVFGAVQSAPQNEAYPLSPISEYAKAKIASMNLVKQYRNEKNIFACTGILFNHESPKRNPFFITRKITQAAVKIKLGLEKELVLGDLDARRDWGYAGDFVEAMWMMLQVLTPEDYVVGTGKTHSVKDILKVAFAHLDLDWTLFVRINDEFKRTPEPYEVVADISLIKNNLGWSPKKSFEEIIIEMVDADMRLFSKK